MSRSDEAQEPAAIYVASMPDMVEVMVTVWADGSAECAFRPAGGHPQPSWGPPVPMESRPVRV